MKFLVIRFQLKLFSACALLIITWILNVKRIKKEKKNRNSARKLSVVHFDGHLLMIKRMDIYAFAHKQKFNSLTFCIRMTIKMIIIELNGIRINLFGLGPVGELRCRYFDSLYSPKSKWLFHLLQNVISWLISSKLFFLYIMCDIIGLLHGTHSVRSFYKPRQVI